MVPHLEQTETTIIVVAAAADLQASTPSDHL